MVFWVKYFFTTAILILDTPLDEIPELVVLFRLPDFVVFAILFAIVFNFYCFIISTIEDCKTNGRIWKTMPLIQHARQFNINNHI